MRTKLPNFEHKARGSVDAATRSEWFTSAYEIGLGSEKWAYFSGPPDHCCNSDVISNEKIEVKHFPSNWVACLQ